MGAGTPLHMEASVAGTGREQPAAGNELRRRRGGARDVRYQR